MLLLALAALVLAACGGETPRPQVITSTPQLTVTPTPTEIPTLRTGIDVPVTVGDLGIQVISAVRADELDDGAEIVRAENPKVDELLIVELYVVGDVGSTDSWPDEGVDAPSILTGDGVVLAKWRRLYTLANLDVVLVFEVPRGGEAMTLRLPGGVLISLGEVPKMEVRPPGQQA